MTGLELFLYFYKGIFLILLLFWAIYFPNLHNSRPFCLLDEPYSGLSLLLTERINTLIKAQSVEKGIIITDHYYFSVLETSIQNYIMKDNSLFRLKSKEELTDYGYLKS